MREIALSEFIQIPADIARVVQGFRDIGYTFPVAIADLVDNSIEAGASVIDVQVYLDQDGKPAVSIADDGGGMDRDGLLNAMRYGAAAVDDPSRLGRFGLGLKTASTGFCRRLTLVSTPGDGVPEMFATWDLDVVEERNDWIYEIGVMTPDQGDAFEEARDALEGLTGERPDKGTLVTWDKVDRLLVNRYGGELINQRAGLETKKRQLREHLGTVFQRYLDPGDNRARTVVVAVDGEKVEPWDPFCEKFEQVKPELARELKLTTADGEDLGSVFVRGFILPHKNDMDDLEYGPTADISLANQGVYVYRENRMIEGPIWLGFTKETHLNQLRIDISYLAAHDDYFIVDVKKKDLKIEPGLDEVIREILPPLRAEANNRARGRGRRPRIDTGTGKSRTERGIDDKDGSLVGPEIAVDGEEVVIVNPSGNTTVRDGDGRSMLEIRIDDEPDGKRVKFEKNLPNGVLWAPGLGTGQGNTQVTLSETHDWYKKTYLPNEDNANFVEAIEYLFFALAQAELNYVNLEMQPLLEELRIEVSRNLARLVSDLPEPDPEA